MPNKYSQLGPGIAVGDVNGDGHEDFYLSGAAGNEGSLFLFRPISIGPRQWTFTRVKFAAFQADAACEDMAPLLFDVDRDGDLDLFVASGGVECEPGEEVLRDRLYINESEENNVAPEFVRAADSALPDARESSGVVTAADFDRDGDLDLFVGGRIIPGQYPATPDSRLLRNDTPAGGPPRLVDVTDALAPAVRHTGLVTGAVWSDADGDGWLDLLVTHEWGPVKLFKNVAGRLEDHTVDAGLANRLGWYNSIAARDLDNDGDIDYVVTNLGLNTKYKASESVPQLLYYGDFDGSGGKHIVEAKFELQSDLEKMCFPVRGLSCSSGAMPILRERLPTFHQFASSTLQDIYGHALLGAADKFEVNSLESGVLINDGQAHFHFQTLPRLAQASPCFGVVTGDFDGDAMADIFTVQNFFGPQRETGYMDGGVSVLLLGSGGEESPQFKTVRPDQSGLVVPGDAKCLATLDLNGDGWLDLLVGVNNSDLHVFENRNAGPHRPCFVRLVGHPGNAAAVGGRVTLHLQSGPSQTAEVHAGSGYLSQSTAGLQFGIPEGDAVREIEIRWPDGSRSSHPGPEDAGAHTVEIEWPR